MLPFMDCCTVGIIYQPLQKVTCMTCELVSVHGLLYIHFSVGIVNQSVLESTCMSRELAFFHGLLYSRNGISALTRGYLHAL